MAESTESTRPATPSSTLHPGVSYPWALAYTLLAFGAGALVMTLVTQIGWDRSGWMIVTMQVFLGTAYAVQQLARTSDQSGPGDQPSPASEQDRPHVSGGG